MDNSDGNLNRIANQYEKRINLRSVIDLPQLESLLTSICQRLDMQDAAITTLQNTMAQTASQAETREAIRVVQAVLDRLSDNIERLNTLATAKIGNTMYSIAEIAVSNHNHIEELRQAQASFANIVDMQRAFQQLQESMTHEISTAKSQLAPLELSLKLQSAQRDIVNRLSALDSNVQCKIDRTEISELQLLSEKFRFYEDFKTNTIERVQNLENVSRNHKALIDRSHDRIHILDINQQKLDSEVNRRTEISETERIANIVQRIENEMKKFAEQTSMDKVNRHCLELQRFCDRLQLKSNDHDSTLTSHEAAIAKKAEAKDLKNYVLRSHFEDIVVNFGEHLDNKSEICDVAKIDQRLELLEDKVASESELTAVAIRFATWFAERGQSYESNLRVLDDHLSKLSVGAVRLAQREPFETVRYRETQREDKGTTNSNIHMFDDHEIDALLQGR